MSTIHSKVKPPVLDRKEVHTEKGLLRENAPETPGNVAKTLGAFIYKMRRDRGISVRQLAQKLGVSPSVVSEIERGKRFASDPVLEKIASEFCVPTAELRKFDSNAQLEALKHLMQECPDIRLALHAIIAEVLDGRMTAEELAHLLRSANSRPTER